ncbi:MAG TPA: hypothetical protein DCP20_11260 [Coriobacteriia bacterium]|uniref:DUF6812 domain-containing protein n=1 Tax=Anaerosoma tenue TaxID=2933588 RepID=UPI00076DED27|nr:hypothetical protein [Anaerosoma tenue]KUK48193.1 MAG: hypothetical protein XD74_1185 [Actinobacteria bacterium 66_15]MCK8115725.1 hypothetical protein [Anaerosoma tenue]HAL31268.1 hypothetical protein [Coriobacteriia bacterium]
MAITKKDTVRVMIITKDHRIEGDMHILEGARLSDSLNAKNKDFYAVTEASIFRVEDDRLVASPPFIIVGREAISAVFPMEE